MNQRTKMGMVKRPSMVFVMAALAGLTACTPNKTVTLHSEPLGAALTITKMVNGNLTEQVPANIPDPLTKITTQEFSFPKENTPSYKVSATLERYRENSVVIGWDQMKDYVIPLIEYKRPMDSISFEPNHAARTWLVAPVFTQQMAYLQTPVDPNGVVYKEVQITNSKDEGKTDYLSMAASPTADEIVYQKVQKQAGGNYTSQLFIRKIKSGTESKLTTTRSQEYTPAFTFGGDYVVFSSDNASENPTLWKIKSDGKSMLITSLTRNDSADYAPSVGQTLMVYTSCPPNALSPQIWRCSLDGREAGLLGDGSAPQLSPDEREILFLHPDKDGLNQLWLMDKDGGNLRQVTQSNGFAIADARWSPDGKWIAYSCTAGKDEDGQPNADIWVIAAESADKMIQLTHNGSCDTSPAWDRNGSSLYFRSNRGGSWNIWKLDIRPNVLTAGN